MNHYKREQFKRQACLSHRVAQYNKALDGLIATAKGTQGVDFKPDYVTIRFKKVKELL